VQSADRALVCGSLLFGSGVAIHGSELPFRSTSWLVAASENDEQLVATAVDDRPRRKGGLG
jgi:hypothetical protein